MKDKRLNRHLENELRTSRPEPRVDFARALADEVRSRRVPERSPLGRVGLALALSGLIVVALASFGGIGYASSAASHSVKKQVVPKHDVWIVKKAKTAAAAQYGPCPPECAPTVTPPANPPSTTPFTPPTTNPPSTPGKNAPFTPPTTNPPSTPGKNETNGTNATNSSGGGQAGAPKATSSQLPFTGLALWVPLAIGLMLISLGLVLRTRGRRRHTGAH
jgi:hypothetical protein